MPDFVDVFARIHGRLPGSSDIPATAKWLSLQEPPMPLADVHRRLATLRAKGWVRTYKGQTGNDYAGLLVEPASRRLLEAIHALQQAVPGRSWGSTFHAERPVFLDTMHHVGSVTEAARICRFSSSTAYDNVRAMHQEATLVRHGDAYRLNDRVPPLHDAIHEAARLATIRRIAGDDVQQPPFDLVWHQGPEAVVSSGAELVGLRPGGLDAFAEHGLEFSTRRRTFYAGWRKLDAADAILQAILTDPSSAQVRSYAALLYEKDRLDSLERKAVWYGLRDAPALFHRYVDQRVEVEGFLPQKEYARLKALYGVQT